MADPIPPSPTSIRDMVAENLSKSGPKVKEIVITALTTEEIDKRTDIVRKALPLLDAARNIVASAKPDVVTYNGDGSVKDQAWSKQALENRKKAEEKLVKLEAAFDKAINQSDFGDLTKIIQQGGSKEPRDGEQAAKGREE